MNFIPRLVDFNPIILPRKTFHIHCSKQELYKCRRKSFTRCYYLSYNLSLTFAYFLLTLQASPIHTWHRKTNVKPLKASYYPAIRFLGTQYIHLCGVSKELLLPFDQHKMITVSQFCPLLKLCHTPSHLQLFQGLRY